MMKEGQEKPFDRLEGPKAACETMVEQTKLLVTLASAFVVAPAAVLAVTRLHIDHWIIIAEIIFIISVLAGYIALGSIAGSQHQGQFNVYDDNIKWSGRVQFYSYLLGLAFFMIWLSGFIDPTA